MARYHGVRPLRCGRRARAAWTPTPDATPTEQMRTCLVRFNALVHLLNPHARGTQRMEHVLAARTPTELLDRYAADHGGPRPRISYLDVTTTGAVHTHCELRPEPTLGGWPMPEHISTLELPIDGAITVRDHRGGPLPVRGWTGVTIAMAVLLDGVGEQPVPPRSVATDDAVRSAEAMLGHLAPHLAEVPLDQTGPIGRAIAHRVAPDLASS